MVDDDDYAKQPDNTFKAVYSRMRPLMREFLHVRHRERCFRRGDVCFAVRRTRIRDARSLISNEVGE